MFSNYIIPYSNLKNTSLMYDIIHKKLAFNLEEGVFFDELDGIYFNGPTHSAASNIICGDGGETSTYNGNTGGNGGSGVVIIRYLGSTRGSGGTITSSGGYTYHTFNSSGTFTA